MVFPDYCYTSASSLKSATMRLYGSENRVGTACAKCRMKREVIHQMSGDILYAGAATETNAHKRTVSLSQMSNDELARALSWRETVG